MYKLKIKVTKDILKKSMMCGTDDQLIVHGCAVALAVREIFPYASVGGDTISPYMKAMFNPNHMIELPRSASCFIADFDRLRLQPEKRLDLPELEFEVSLPQSVIDAVNISELEQTLKTSETLELVKGRKI